MGELATADAQELVRAQLEESVRVKQLLAVEAVDDIVSAARLISGALRSGGKVLLCGNGGSAADAQHIAAELVSRFRRERPALPAIALSTDTSILTAIANDYSFDRVFARQVEALGQAGDVLIAITTSGHSANVLRAVEAARRRGVTTIGLTGSTGGKLAALVDLCLRMPSTETPRVQEAHICVAHIICDLVEGESLADGG